MLKSIIRDKKIITIPNALSVFRIAIIPAIVYYINKQYQLAFFYLLLSGVTDVLDAVADKLTQGSILIALAKSTPWMTALCVLLIAKESVMVVFGLIVLRRTNKTYNARWHGKVSNGCIYSTLAAHIIWGNMPNIYSNGMIILCGAAMLLSLVLYCQQYASILKDTNSTV